MSDKKHPHKIKIEGGNIEVFVQSPENGLRPKAVITAYLVIDPIDSPDEVKRVFGGDYLTDVPNIYGYYPEKWVNFALDPKMRLRLDLPVDCPSRESVVEIGTRVMCDILGRYRVARATREAALRAMEIALHDAGW